MDDSESSDDETSPGKSPSTQELDRTPSERHAFLFRHNLGSPTQDSREFHPLPSQIPFILSIFAENVNMVVQMVHMPTMTKMARDLRLNDSSSITPANEALLFSLYYAAITSMEEDDVRNFLLVLTLEARCDWMSGADYVLSRSSPTLAPPKTSSVLNIASA